jgi:hypothetical protein
MSVATAKTQGKVPGESVRNKPLHSKSGKPVGRILDIVHTKDHRRIKFGLVEFGQPGSTAAKRFAIAWDTVLFDEHGKASLTYELDEELLAKAELLEPEDQQDVERQERLADVYYFDHRQTPL